MILNFFLYFINIFRSYTLYTKEIYLTTLITYFYKNNIGCTMLFVRTRFVAKSKTNGLMPKMSKIMNL